MSKLLKETPTHCWLLNCQRYFPTPGENDVRCTRCPGLKDRNWKPRTAGGGQGGGNSSPRKERKP
jgi:hypothetical protein